MDISTGVLVLVVVGSGDEFSTAWGCYGCKISVVKFAKFEERIAKLLKRVGKFEKRMGYFKY